MRKFYNHLWTNYKKRTQHCKRCNLLMTTSELKGNCMSLNEKRMAQFELRWESKWYYTRRRGLYYNAIYEIIKVEEMRKRS